MTAFSSLSIPCHAVPYIDRWMDERSGLGLGFPLRDFILPWGRNVKGRKMRENK
jgi:hypothetical protein